MKSEAVISRRLTQKAFSVNVVTTANSFPKRSRCRVSWRSQSKQRWSNAVVVLPGDVALREAINSKPRIHFAEIATTVRPSDEILAKAAGILNESRKVTIFGGAGCADAHTELMQLAGKLKAPIVHALRGKEFIEYDNPFDVGMTGLLGFSKCASAPAANAAVSSCRT
jgi:thiamine pyrophosphate-dependent acetolactate synthase large subunit-like protein